MTRVYVVFRSNYHNCADNRYTPSHMEVFQNRENAAHYANSCAYLMEEE